VVGGLDDRVHAEHQPGGDRHRADHVGACAQPDPALGRQQAHREHPGRQPDREVDEEDPVPAEQVGEDAAGEQADRCAGRGDEAVDADRLGPLHRLREQRHHHAQRHRRGHRAADPLDEPGGDQQLLAAGQPAQQRGHREHRQAGHEDPLAAEQIAQPAGQQQQAAEGDQVRVDDPREVGLREAEVALDRVQRHVHDGLVEDDHQHAGAQHRQRQPAGPAGDAGT
jgi:hypothetical protein